MKQSLLTDLFTCFNSARLRSTTSRKLRSRMRSPATMPAPAPPALFTPLALAHSGPQLRHRVVMAPMTRNRGVPPPPPPPPSTSAPPPDEPNRVWLADELVARYYGQRASFGGLLITEGIPPSPTASGMPFVPGLFSPAQVPGWRAVTDAVHAAGGVVFAQLWHAGRAALPPFTGAETAVGASAVAWEDGEETYPFRTPVVAEEGKKGEKVKYVDFPPVEMTEEGIRRTIGEFVEAARRAVGECGFDGVEINGGNGNLIDQFLHSNLNRRTDAYGGSPARRCAFALELAAALAAAVGPARVGVRLEPAGLYQGTRGAERLATWSFLCRELAARGLVAYAHFIEPRWDRIEKEGEEVFARAWGAEVGEVVSNAPFRKIFQDAGVPCFSCGGWDADNVAEAVEAGWDGVVFGKWFTSNPDLPERLRKGRPLAPFDRSRFYGSWDGVRENGYTTYPKCDEAEDDEVGAQLEGEAREARVGV